uniref:non-specific serine/threonine protein kinase n=1 Tax=Anopheles maculatus TaxID=74869 RepID=A0A182T9Z5_9DIPT
MLTTTAMPVTELLDAQLLQGGPAHIKEDSVIIVRSKTLFVFEADTITLVQLQQLLLGLLPSQQFKRPVQVCSERIAESRVTVFVGAGQSAKVFGYAYASGIRYGAGQVENAGRMSHPTPILSSAISRRNPEDEYELIHKIGSGTYGDVYKAKKLQSNDLAAIKVIKLEQGDDIQIIQQEI